MRTLIRIFAAIPTVRLIVRFAAAFGRRKPPRPVGGERGGSRPQEPPRQPRASRPAEMLITLEECQRCVCLEQMWEGNSRCLVLGGGGASEPLLYCLEGPYHECKYLDGDVG